jgi:TPR repeat protein
MGMNRTFKAAVAALMLAVSFAGSRQVHSRTMARQWIGIARRPSKATPVLKKVSRACTIWVGVWRRTYAAAASWYRKVAERGDPGAQVDLGLMYHHGQVVPQDYVIAHVWFNLAAASGDNDNRKIAAELRDDVAKQMTPAQIAQAQKLAREWKPTPAPP